METTGSQIQNQTDMLRFIKSDFSKNSKTNHLTIQLLYNLLKLIILFGLKSDQNPLSLQEYLLLRVYRK